MKSYRLHAWVVMASHIHVRLTPFVEVPKITHSFKRFTAREANRILGLTGQPFSQDESFDHLVRDAGEFERIAHYIENNPVTAGLVFGARTFPGPALHAAAKKADCKSAAAFKAAPQCRLQVQPR